MQTKRKQSITIEWQIAETDREWAQLMSPAGPTGVSPRRWPRWLGEGLLLILMVGGIGSWQWYTTKAEWQRAKQELTAAVQQEITVISPAWPTTAPQWRLESAQAEHGLQIAAKSAMPGTQFTPTIHLVELQSDQAAVMVITPAIAQAPAYRETQFYRHTAAGWQRTAPAAALWGPLRQRETASFHWRYRERDAPVVAAVAPQLEMIYATVRHTFV